jgi:multiple sugar transport system substrate-binding protein
MARKSSLVLVMLCIAALGTVYAVDLNVIGFKVGPDEIGTPLDKAHQWLITSFMAKNPGVKVNALEAPPDFDTQLYVDLAAGTGPDLWYADASTLARLGDSGYLMDMRDMTKYVPGFSFDRFWPTVLDIHKGKKGEYWGIPSDFTPMVIFYNPEVFAKAKAALPGAKWTWNDLVKAAQLTTLDANGRNRLDPAFDEKNVATWGYRVRQYTFEWIYRVWENGSDVISPDGTTVSGYLDAPATIEALQFQQDLILKYKVAPQPSALDQLNQGMGFNDRFLQGKAAMFDRGHWELVGLRSSKNFNGKNIGIAVQPSKKNNLTVLYESGFVINKNAKGDVLAAACRFADMATDMDYQVMKATSNLAIPGNKKAAEKAATQVQFPDIEKAFLAQVPTGRLPYGSKYVKWPAVETILDGMMDKIIHGTDVKTAVAAAVTEANRELGK